MARPRELVLGDVEQAPRSRCRRPGEEPTPNARSIGGEPSSASDWRDLVGDPARDDLGVGAVRVEPDAEQDAADPAGLAVARRQARDLGEQQVRGVVALGPRDLGEAVDGDQHDRADADVRETCACTVETHWRRVARPVRSSTREASATLSTRSSTPVVAIARSGAPACRASESSAELVRPMPVHRQVEQVRVDLGAHQQVGDGVGDLDAGGLARRARRGRSGRRGAARSPR